jgi:hypothetical protein
MADYSTPILLKSDYIAKVTLKNKIPELLDYYFKNLYDPISRLILLPTPDLRCYDGLLADFLFKITNISDHPTLNKVNRLTYPLDNSIDYTIWDVLIKQDKKLLKLCSNDIDFIKVTPTNNYGTIIDISAHNVAYILNKVNSIAMVYSGEIRDIKKNYVVTNIPIAKNTTNAKTYVMSEFLYNMDAKNCGYLENLVLSYLNCEAIDISRINIVLDEYKGWDTVTQLYGIPIIILLIKYISSNIVSEL